MVVGVEMVGLIGGFAGEQGAIREANCHWNYPNVSSVLGAVLVFAASVKCFAVLSGDVPPVLASLARPAVWLLISCEALFGLWLQAGSYPRWTRPGAVLAFSGMLIVATVQLGKDKEESLARLDADFQHVLRPEQVARLESLDRKLDVMRRGYLATLTSGMMHNTLRVSDAQRTAIATKAGSLRVALMRETAQWEAMVETALLQELPDAARQQMLERLGPPLSNTPGNITLLLFDLAM